MKCCTVRAPLLLLAGALLCLISTGSTNAESSLSVPEKVLAATLEKLALVQAETTGLSADVMITVNDSPEEPSIVYSFTLYLGSGKRFKCAVKESPFGPLTAGAAGDGIFWVYFPDDSLVMLTYHAMLEPGLPGDTAVRAISHWVRSLRKEARLRHASSTHSEAVMILPLHQQDAEIADIKRVVLWLNRATGLPRETLVYDAKYTLKAQAKVTGEWETVHTFTPNFFSPPADAQVSHIDVQAFMDAFSESGPRIE